MPATYKITQIFAGGRKFSCSVQLNGRTAEYYEVEIPKGTLNPRQFVDTELMNEASKQLVADVPASDDASLISNINIDANGKVII